MKGKNSVLLTAAMSGLLIAAGCSSSQAGSNDSAKTSMGKCYGVNACKGHSDCATKVDACNGKDGCQSMSSCAGQNSCKGKGFKKMSKEQCDKKNGKFEA